MARKITGVGMLVALALLLSYIELLLPISAGIPGIKPGLANLVVLVALYLLPTEEAFLISMLRILLAGMLSGNLISLLFSLSGGICSFFVMLFCYRSNRFSPAGVSLAGGTAHNVAQIAAASVILNTPSLFYYLPLLLLAGIVTGLCNGMIAARILPSVWACYGQPDAEKYD